MRLLVLGGTRFVGRAIVEAALARGHDVTLFNRGTDRDVFPQVPRITGDRDVAADVRAIASHTWDAVVDVSGYRPAQVRSVCDAFDGAPPRYLYISTVSVYALPLAPGAAEDASLLDMPEDVAPSDPAAYGGLKAACERELRARVEHLTVVRPTVVIGPHDTTDRFGWWVRHIRDGAAVRVPRVEQPVQLIDADDLAAFTVRLLGDGTTGTFNAVGPDAPLTLESLAATLREALDADGTALAAPDATENVPLTLPADGSADGAFTVSNARAREAGLTLRPLRDSARAVAAV